MDNKKYGWVAPALVFVAGIFNLLNKNLDGTIRTLWYIITPIALLLMILRIYRQAKTHD
jgi:hypothetical protein